MAQVEVPRDRLDARTLRALVEEFITREGTDYGQGFTLEQKVAHVMQQIEAGDVAVVFDTDLDTCNLATRNQLDKYVED